jgi:toxin ParE1/3/4
VKPKPIIPRELANRDVDESVAYYLNEGSEPAALGFIDALQQGYIHIGRHPATGTPRYGHELDLPGLRFWFLKYSPPLGLLHRTRGAH